MEVEELKETGGQEGGERRRESILEHSRMELYSMEKEEEERRREQVQAALQQISNEVSESMEIVKEVEQGSRDAAAMAERRREREQEQEEELKRAASMEEELWKRIEVGGQFLLPAPLKLRQDLERLLSRRRAKKQGEGAVYCKQRRRRRREEGGTNSRSLWR